MEVVPANRAWLLGRLKYSLQILAAPAEIQLREMSVSGYRTDELYLKFVHWRSKVIGSFSSEIAIDQRALLDSMARTFTGMGRECWTDNGVSNSVEWKHVRLLSRKALRTFGWLV
jgi:hypothetical protein